MAMLLLVLGAVVFAVLSRGWDRPSRYDRNIWSPDPDECERNYRRAIEAWKAARLFVAPSVQAQQDEDFAAARRLPRSADGVAPVGRTALRSPHRHPMRPATWR